MKRGFKYGIIMIVTVALLLFICAMGGCFFFDSCEETAPDFEEGDGTESSPYLVSTAREFTNISKYTSVGYYFELTEDISLRDVSMSPISEFHGNFEGNMHTISYWSYSGSSSSSSEVCVGLFGTNYGSITNVKVSSFDVSVSSTGSGDVAIGALAGISSGTIYNCIAENNTISATHEYCIGTHSYLKTYGGGLVGENTGTLTNSSALSNSVSVSCTSKNSQSDGKFWAKAGGLAGYNNATLTACYASGNSISSEGAGGKTITLTNALVVCDSGGLIGYTGTNGTTSYCFATGNDSLKTSISVVAGSIDDYKYAAQVVAQTNGMVKYCYCLKTDENNTVVDHVNSDGTSDSTNKALSSVEDVYDMEVMANQGWHADDDQAVPTIGW